jgi:hypothetical protein
MADSNVTSTMTRNSLRVIFPYRRNGVWMFDDAATGLSQEPFVAGIPEIIEDLVATIPGADEGFTLFFSERPFPGHQVTLEWAREEIGGNWYRVSGTQMEGWLCPALLRYFQEAPSRIYCRAEARRE